MIELREWNESDDALVAGWLDDGPVSGSVLLQGVKLGAHLHGDLVGFVGMLPLSEGYHAVQVAVSPEYIGTSIAVRIARRGLEEARARGAKMVIAFLHENNEPCQSVARHVGMTKLPYVAMVADVGGDDAN